MIADRVLVAASLFLALRAGADPVTDLDGYVAKAVADWGVPGLAIAVVKDDKVVLAKGYGVRRLGEAPRVEPSTLFAIGSTTKAFTAAVVGTLVDEGKLGLDDPIIKHLPEFRLADAWVTREVTLRDALNHRAGVPNVDETWYATRQSRDEIIARLRQVSPSKGFRKDMQYSNLMFLVAGQAAARAAGKSWDDLVKERLFAPLGMKTANTSVRDNRAGGNWAAPHERIEGELRPVPYHNLDGIAPAGSINASVNDMAQWLRFQLGDGTFAGKKILAADTLATLHQPQMHMPPLPPWLAGRAHIAAYAFGWIVEDYAGKLVLWHNGGIDGMHAAIVLVPEEKLGAVILQNSSSPLPEMLMYRTVDAYLGLVEPDWAARGLEVTRQQRANAEQERKAAEDKRVKGTKPTLDLPAYAGTYHDDVSGDIVVTAEAKGLVFRMGELAGQLAHWNYDTFQLNFRDGFSPPMLAGFVLDATGRPAELRLYDDDRTIAFRRAPVRLSADELRRFAGTYAGPKAAITVALAGDKLTLTVPGQPTYTLAPLSATRFHIEPLPDSFTLEFELAGGKVAAAVTDQPGAHVRWTRR